MKLEVSLQCSQSVAIDLYPKPAECNPQSHNPLPSDLLQYYCPIHVFIPKVDSAFRFSD
jgi:hypothetical protein